MALQQRGEFLFSKPMWYVNNLFDQAQVESLSAKGLPRSQFGRRGAHREVRLRRGVAEDAGRPLSDDRDSHDHDVRPVHAAVGRGLSEISTSNEGKKYPVLVQQLANLRKFNEELRTALGVPTYYNEAIGSTCQLSVYDRVKGRPGDNPDETVGAQEKVEH